MGGRRAGVSQREGCWPARGGDMSGKDGETALQREVDGEEKPRTRHTGRQVGRDGERPRERDGQQQGGQGGRETDPAGGGRGAAGDGAGWVSGRECRGSGRVARV